MVFLTKPFFCYLKSLIFNCIFRFRDSERIEIILPVCVDFFRFSSFFPDASFGRRCDVLRTSNKRPKDRPRTVCCNCCQDLTLYPVFGNVLLLSGVWSLRLSTFPLSYLPAFLPSFLAYEELRLSMNTHNSTDRTPRPIFAHSGTEFASLWSISLRPSNTSPSLAVFFSH